MFCPKCGTENVESTRFCRKCRESLAPDVSKPTGSSVGLDQNLAALLCYFGGWSWAIVFLLIEKENNFIRFHARQSFVTFGTYTLFGIGFTILGGFIFTMLGTNPYLILVFWLIHILIGLLAFVLWIVLMVKAYRGEWYKLPWAGDEAESYISESST